MTGEGPERRSVTASGSVTLDLTRFAEYVATLTAARVIQHLESRPSAQPTAFRPMEPRPTTDPALRGDGPQ